MRQPMAKVQKTKLQKQLDLLNKEAHKVLKAMTVNFNKYKKRHNIIDEKYKDIDEKRNVIQKKIQKQKRRK